MSFIHQFLPRIELESVIDEDGNKLYHTPVGDFSSVTTILKKFLGTKAIDEWKLQVGEDNANQVSTQAKNRGKLMHSIVESFLLNKEWDKQQQMPTNLFAFKQIKPILKEKIKLIYGIELPLYSAFMKCGGQADLVARWEEQNAIIDFKTSLRVKKEKYIESYFLQAAAYSIMVEELYSLFCPLLVVVIMVDHNLPQIFVRRRTPYMKRCIEIFTSEK